MYSTEEENYVWPQDSCNINMPFQFISIFHCDKFYAISEGKLSIYVLTIWCEDWLVEYSIMQCIINWRISINIFVSVLKT